MSQRSEKLRRQVEVLKERMDVMDSRVVELERSAAAWDAAEASVHNQAALDAATQRNAERRRARQAERTAALWRRVAYIALVAAIIVEIIAILVIHANAACTAPVDPPVVETAAAPMEEPEEAENDLIEAALLARANVIEDCEVTWYTEDTCGKTPDDPAYGITRSGLPVVEHLTCAVDPEVIPMYSDVFVEYADGTIEQLWATDTGVKGNSLDIYTPDYDYAIQCGRQRLNVYWVAPDSDHNPA